MDSSMTGGFDANIAFIICLVLGIVFLALSILFFFLFNIPKVYLIRTGKGARKTIRKMEEINAETGRLRRNNDNYTLNSDVPITGEMGQTPSHSIDYNQGAQPQPSQQAQQPQQQPQQQRPLPRPDAVGDGNNLTTVLGPGETTIMRGSETTVLSQDMLHGPTAKYVYNRQTSGKFVVTFNLMYVHSNEVI